MRHASPEECVLNKSCLEVLVRCGSGDTVLISQGSRRVT
jgi:hypothetical protein